MFVLRGQSCDVVFCLTGATPTILVKDERTSPSASTGLSSTSAKPCQFSEWVRIFPRTRFLNNTFRFMWRPVSDLLLPFKFSSFLPIKILLAWTQTQWHCAVLANGGGHIFEIPDASLSHTGVAPSLPPQREKARIPKQVSVCGGLERAFSVFSEGFERTTVTTLLLCWLIDVDVELKLLL